MQFCASRKAFVIAIFTSKNSKYIWSALISLLVLAAGPASLYAQVDTGSISGTVRDSSGAVIPDAAITLQNPSTGLIFRATTNSVGLYQFSAIRIGTYTLSVEAKGFSKATQENVSLSIQQNLVADFTLTPGNVNQQVEVTTAQQQLQTEDASVGGVVEERAINDLPLNGRNYTFLAQLNAGVTQSQQDSRGLGSSGSFTANGTAANQNNYLLDGIDNNSNLVDFLNGNSYVYKPSVDSLSEFKVQTGNFSAEFGRAAGAVLNATTKSGSSQFHGDVWEFFRNDALDANNYFEQQKGRYQQNQFGATLGGPISPLNHGKMKTFFFVDYEGTRINQATPYTSSVPTALERSSGFTNLSELLAQGGTQTDLLGRNFASGQVLDPATTRPVTAGQHDPVTGLTAQGSGYVRDPFPGNLLPAARVGANAVNMLNQFPTPTSNSLFSNYFSDPLLTDRLDQGDFRLDQTFGDHDLAFGRYSRSDETEYVPGPFDTIINGGGFNTGNQTNVADNAVVGWTHIFSPSLVNEARFGFGSVDTLRTQAFSNDLTVPSQYGILGIPPAPNNGGLPTYTLSGLTEIGGSPWEPTHEANNTYQLTENITKTVGKQTFKGGFEYQHVVLHFYQPAYPRGSFDFDGAYTEVPTYTSGNTGVAQLVLEPTASTVAGGINFVGGSDTVNGSNQATPSITRHYYAGYGQDDWKLNSKTTVNLGLRYEYFGHGVAPGGNALNYLPPSGSTAAELLMPNSTCKSNLFSPSVLAAFSTDNIGIACTGNNALVQSDKADFAPRVGISYQPTPRLVVRSAFGLFYGSTVNGDNLVDAINYPFSYTETYNEPDPGHPITYPNGQIATFENGLSAISFTPTAVNAAGVAFTGTDYHFQTPYTQEYNLSVQVQIAANQSFTLGYVGTQGRHLQVHDNYNTPTQILVPGENPQNFVAYPNFARGFTKNSTEANSQYNAMQATYQFSPRGGLNFLANYTWSKCRTDARDILTNDIGSYRAPQLPGFGIKGDYALCDYDVTNIFHLSGIYALPVGRGKALLGNSSAITDALFGGWQTNFILTLQGGQPFTVPCNISTTAAFGCNANVVFGESLYGQHNVNQWMNPAAFTNPPVATANGQSDYSVLGGPPTQLYGPGWRRLDMSVFKIFNLSKEGGRRLEFRAEFFNLPNHPNFGNPGFSAPGIAAAPGALNFSSNTFGQILGTRDGASDQREIQFALKFYF
jgi:hypothetical protein